MPCVEVQWRRTPEETSRNIGSPVAPGSLVRSSTPIARADFGIAESRMLGYWLEDAPVTTDNPRVLATTYVRSGEALIALASWSDEDEIVRLSVDSTVLGNSADWRIVAPAVEGLQSAAEVDLASVRIPANQGLFILMQTDES